MIYYYMVMNNVEKGRNLQQLANENTEDDEYQVVLEMKLKHLEDVMNDNERHQNRPLFHQNNYDIITKI